MKDFLGKAKKALKNRNISLKAARWLAGQQEWANHFLENGSLHFISAFRCIANHERGNERRISPSLRWKEDLQWSIQMCHPGNLRPFIENPSYLHGGNVEGDASTLDGWGFHIGPVFAFGMLVPGLLSREPKKQNVLVFASAFLLWNYGCKSL